MDELIVQDEQSLNELIKRVRAAQAKFATYTQEQVDKIFLAAATAADKARLDLAEMAVSETGMGIVEDKVIKNHYAAEYIYNAYRDVKTHVHRYIQSVARAQNAQRSYFLAAPARKELHDCGGSHRSRRGCQSGCARGYYRLDRRAERRAFRGGHER